ncbi:hypothetical protein ACS0TY_001055 [Phlomoides rotata]
MADELSLIDEPMKPDDLTLFVINGLGPDYASIVGPIRACETPLRFEELHDLLCAHESSLHSSQAAAASLVATANTARTGRSSAGSGKSHGNSHGNSGRRPSSGNSYPNGSNSFNSMPSSAQTWNPNGKQSGSSDSRPPPITCQLCGFRGHAAPTCRRVPLPLANFAASPSGSPAHSPWMVDSGASHNLTADLGNLSIHSKYDGTDEVHIADGSSLPISHSGTGFLRFPSPMLALGLTQHP